MHSFVVKCLVREQKSVSHDRTRQDPPPSQTVEKSLPDDPVRQPACVALLHVRSNFILKGKKKSLHLVNSECTGKKDYGGFGRADEETSA